MHIYDINDADINIFDYKRYKMSDINKLDKRLSNHELLLHFLVEVMLQIFQSKIGMVG